MDQKLITPVTELLDKNDITYHRLPHDREVMTIEMAAQQRGVDPDEMVKCILLRDNKKRYVMACLLGFDKLNTQTVREYVNVKRLSFASPDEIEAIIGYRMGAVPPIAHKTPIPVVFDIRIKQCEKVNISSGDHLLGLELAANDLIHMVDNLIWGDIHTKD